MISLQVLQSNISKCQSNTRLSLPNQNRDFVQNTAYDFKVKQLKHSAGANNLINQMPDYTMQKEIDKLQDNMDNNEMDNPVVSESYIPNKSLILITENSTIDLPETLLDIFGLTGICQEDYYLYGVRNPDSFYNSILLQLKNSFILGKKNDKRNDVSTFKNEIVIKFDAFYKKLEYKKYGVVRTKFLSSILNEDNYVNYDVLLYLADYFQINLVIVDVVDMKYCNIKYENSDLSEFNQTDISRQEIGFDNYNLEHGSDKCLMIIKYEGDTYLPIMCKTGNHFADSNVVETLEEQDYTPIYDDKFKVRKATKLGLSATKANEAITDLVLGDKQDEMADIEKILDTVKSKKDAKAKAKKEKSMKPKKKEVKKKVEPELPTEDLGDSSDEESTKTQLKTVQPANIFSIDWIKQHCAKPTKQSLRILDSTNYSTFVNTVEHYDVSLTKKDKNGKEIKVTLIQLAKELYKICKNK